MTGVSAHACDDLLARQIYPFGCGADGMPADWDLPPDRKPLCVKPEFRIIPGF